MKILIVFDSQFGNTEKIARSLGECFLKQDQVKIVNVTQVQTDDTKDLDYLIIGSPTQGGRPTPKLQAWLMALSKSNLDQVKIAVFDTRLEASLQPFWLKLLMKLIDYAAPKMGKILTAKGGKLMLPPEGFIVTNKSGPLKAGELSRAQTWLKAALA
jgi:flavodoxin I